MMVSWFIAASVYTGYCMLWEIAFGLTPGKLAVRCRVTTETGERCTPSQIVMRNTLRLIELFPPFKALPIMVFVMFTRNRQRLGDLIARTIVVETIDDADAFMTDREQDSQDEGTNPSQEQNDHSDRSTN